MAEAAQQELSPEEKLLRVIQGGDAEKPAAPAKVIPPAKPVPPVAAPAAAQALRPTPAPVLPPVPAPVSAPAPAPPPRPPVVSEPASEARPASAAVPPPQKPKLKPASPARAPAAQAVAEPRPSPVPPKAVGKPEPEPQAKPEEPKKAEAQRPEDAGPGKKTEAQRPEEARPGKKAARRSERRPAAPAVPVAAAGKPARRRSGGPIGTANRVLTLVILVLLGLCGLQIWSGATAGGVAPPPAETPVFAGEEGEFELPAIALLQGAFREKQIWDFGEPAGPRPGPGPEPPPPPQPEIEKVLKLIGLSAPPGAPSEKIVAVIIDNRDSRMHFVKIGEKLPFNGREFDVKNVASDQVVLADGGQEYRVR